MSVRANVFGFEENEFRVSIEGAALRLWAKRKRM